MVTRRRFKDGKGHDSDPTVGGLGRLSLKLNQKFEKLQFYPKYTNFPNNKRYNILRQTKNKRLKTLKTETGD